MNKFIQTFINDSDELFSESNVESKTCRNFALITALLALASVCGFISFYLEPLYYGVLFINLIYFISVGKNRINPAFLFLYIVLIINVSLVNIPPFFKPAQRLILFMLVTLTTSSVLQSELALQFRRLLFKYVIFGLSILSIGSFFCFFLGINMMSRRNIGMTDFDVYSNNGGWFSGLTTHSMMLGPISMIASLFFFVLYLQKQSKGYLILFFTTIMSAVFASSRSALLGIAVAILYCLFFGHLNPLMKRRLIGMLAFCSILTLPISDVAFKGVINKQQQRSSQNSSLNSRQDKFDYRIAEFKSSPILGVGFCAVDINGGDGYGERDGRIEPGTSHLSVLSMTGLLGMAAYLILLYQAFSHPLKTRSVHSLFVLLCFIAMFTHAWFEGYVFSAGGFLAFLYWLIIGQCIDCEETDNEIIDSESATDS